VLQKKEIQSILVLQKSEIQSICASEKRNSVNTCASEKRNSVNTYASEKINYYKIHSPEYQNSPLTLHKLQLLYVSTLTFFSVSDLADYQYISSV
jgi:hypothetical protein